MIASKKTIGKLGMYIIPSKENSLGYDINPAYVIERTPKRKNKKLTKLQRRRKAQKAGQVSHMYNLLHR